MLTQKESSHQGENSSRIGNLYKLGEVFAKKMPNFEDELNSCEISFPDYNYLAIIKR